MTRSEVLGLVDSGSREELRELQLFWITEASHRGLADPLGGRAAGLLLASVEKLILQRAQVATPAGVAFDVGDVVGVVSERLYRAILRWDATKGASPITYLSSEIQYGIRDYLRSCSNHRDRLTLSGEHYELDGALGIGSQSDIDDARSTVTVDALERDLDLLCSGTADSAAVTFSSPVAFWVSSCNLDVDHLRMRSSSCADRNSLPVL